MKTIHEAWIENRGGCMTTSLKPWRKQGKIGIGLALALTSCYALFASSVQADNLIAMKGSRPAIMQTARAMEPVKSSETIRIAFTLPVRNQAILSETLRHLYTPGDTAFGAYLSPEEFAASFSPTQADYDALIKFVKSQGLTVVGTHSNRLLLDVSGPASVMERTFTTKLRQYQTPSGRIFRAPESDPFLPASIASKVTGVTGLDNASVWKTHLVERSSLQSLLVPHGGTGPGGGLAPSDIKTAYNLAGTSLNGTGQTLGLFQLDGYTASDIAQYETTFGLPSVPLQNVLVDGVTGIPSTGANSGAGEVTLDIELQIAMAPGATKVIIYEGPNSNAGVLDTYNRIATDNLAKQISTSWGLAEGSNSSSALNSENTIFQQMAAQGQTIYAASGDSGAYDNGSSLSVDDPASQPFMMGVGGTRLTTNGAGGSYVSEKTWNGGSIAAGGGGGGISGFWAIPTYQSGIVSTASKGSTTKRNVPDVSLNSDPNTGYSIYYSGQWVVYGGTSCAAPLWAGFTALVNQQRVANAKPVLGDPHAALKTIGTGTAYGTSFHDIADNSTNLFYPAVTSFDDATGWGTINGLGLITSLSGVTTGGGGGGPTQLLVNPGFENGSSAAPWVLTAGVINNSSSQPAHGGAWDAWLNGYGTAHTDSAYQQVAVASTVTSATLTFWLHIDSAETTTTAQNDTLKVQIRNSAGTVLATLATYSNLNKAAGYSQKSFNLLAYKGQTIQIYLVGVENSTKATSFVVDDFALNVQ